MARLIPDTDVEAIGNAGERAVARALVAQLPEDCLVFHSYPWLRPARDARGGVRFLEEGEADFLVLDRRWGMLVLEVKGGTVTYDAGRRGWGRDKGGGRWESITDPFEQVSRTFHHLETSLCRARFGGVGHVPFAFGGAVVFPDCRWEGEVPPGGDPRVLFDGRDLGRLGERVISTLRDWSRAGRPPMTPEHFERARAGLLPAFRVVPLLSRRVEEDERRLVRMTDGQAAAFGGLFGNDRVLVEGPAGSGKTLLAAARAVAFARDGKSTLLLCYNRALADSIRRALARELPAEVMARLHVNTFHGLAHDLHRRAGVAFEPPGGGPAGEAFWREEVAESVYALLDRCPTQFDAIIVDEAQDFFPAWWTAIELLNALGERGPLYLFCDPRQNVFDTPLEFPAVQTRYALQFNCRNTRRIAEYHARALGAAPGVQADAPEGQAVRASVLADGAARRAAAERRVADWLGGGLRPSQVAVIGPKTLAKSCLGGATAIAGHPLVDDPAAWERGEGVLYATLAGFKGLEADAVALVDVGRYDRTFGPAHLYVAASRPKHLLAVFLASELQGADVQ